MAIRIIFPNPLKRKGVLISSKARRVLISLLIHWKLVKVECSRTQIFFLGGNLTLARNNYFLTEYTKSDTHAVCNNFDCKCLSFITMYELPQPGGLVADFGQPGHRLASCSFQRLCLV